MSRILLKHTKLRSYFMLLITMCTLRCICSELKTGYKYPNWGIALEKFAPVGQEARKYTQAAQDLGYFLRRAAKNAQTLLKASPTPMQLLRNVQTFLQTSPTPMQLLYDHKIIKKLDTIISLLKGSELDLGAYYSATAELLASAILYEKKINNPSISVDIKKLIKHTIIYISLFEKIATQYTTQEDITQKELNALLSLRDMIVLLILADNLIKTLPAQEEKDLTQYLLTYSNIQYRLAVSKITQEKMERQKQKEKAKFKPGMPLDEMLLQDLEQRGIIHKKADAPTPEEKQAALELKKTEQEKTKKREQAKAELEARLPKMEQLMKELEAKQKEFEERKKSRQAG